VRAYCYYHKIIWWVYIYTYIYYIVQPMMMGRKIICINERLNAAGSLSILAGRCRMSSPPLSHYYYYYSPRPVGQFHFSLIFFHQIPNLLRIAKCFCPVCVTSRNRWAYRVCIIILYTAKFRAQHPGIIQLLVCHIINYNIP